MQAKGWMGWVLSMAVLSTGCSSTSTPHEAAPKSQAMTFPTLDAGTFSGPAPVPAIAPTLRILPSTVYSGVDGVHSFRVPIEVWGATEATVTVSDPEGLEMANAEHEKAPAAKGFHRMLTMKKPGVYTVTASRGAESATASVVVSAYPPDAWAKGEARYMKGTGGQKDRERPCAECHQGPGAVDHSPTALASAADGDVRAVITTGVLGEGKVITEVIHKWAATEGELDGLLVFLRALRPAGFRY